MFTFDFDFTTITTAAFATVIPTTIIILHTDSYTALIDVGFNASLVERVSVLRDLLRFSTKDSDSAAVNLRPNARLDTIIRALISLFRIACGRERAKVALVVEDSHRSGSILWLLLRSLAEISDKGMNFPLLIIATTDAAIPEKLASERLLTQLSPNCMTFGLKSPKAPILPLMPQKEGLKSVLFTFSVVCTWGRPVRARHIERASGMSFDLVAKAIKQLLKEGWLRRSSQQPRLLYFEHGENASESARVKFFAKEEKLLKQEEERGESCYYFSSYDAHLFAYEEFFKADMTRLQELHHDTARALCVSRVPNVSKFDENVEKFAVACHLAEAEGGPPVSLIAHHLSKAGKTVVAQELWNQASLRSFSVGADAEAGGALRRAMELEKRSGPQKRFFGGNSAELERERLASNCEDFVKSIALYDPPRAVCEGISILKTLTLLSDSSFSFRSFSSALQNLRGKQRDANVLTAEERTFAHASVSLAHIVRAIVMNDEAALAAKSMGFSAYELISTAIRHAVASHSIRALFECAPLTSPSGKSRNLPKINVVDNLLSRMSVAVPGLSDDIKAEIELAVTEAEQFFATNKRWELPSSALSGAYEHKLWQCVGSADAEIATEIGFKWGMVIGLGDSYSRVFFHRSMGLACATFDAHATTLRSHGSALARLGVAYEHREILLLGQALFRYGELLANENIERVDQGNPEEEVQFLRERGISVMVHDSTELKKGLEKQEIKVMYGPPVLRPERTFPTFDEDDVTESDVKLRDGLFALAVKCFEAVCEGDNIRSMGIARRILAVLKQFGQAGGEKESYHCVYPLLGHCMIEVRVRAEEADDSVLAAGARSTLARLVRYISPMKKKFNHLAAVHGLYAASLKRLDIVYENDTQPGGDVKEELRSALSLIRDTKMRQLEGHALLEVCGRFKECV